MGKRVQPGGRVDEATYEKFRDFVEQQHGAVRGNLGRELEKAMRNRMKDANRKDSMTRIEDDVATIKAMLAEAEADGGVVAPTPSEASDTHAREMSKPAANQPRQKKVDYLYNRFLEKEGCNSDGGTLTRGAVETIVKKQYGFDGEILDDYVNRVYKKVEKEFKPVPHPVHGGFLVWGDRLEEAKEEAEKQAQEDMEDLE
jgi:hypothetical protein